MSLPAMEALRADYTELWCAGQNVPLGRFADETRSIVGVGLDRLGILEAGDVVERLRGFDSIVSWYGARRPEFRELVDGLGLPFRFLDALPDGTCHAVEFYNRQTGGAGWPAIDVPARPREFAVIHPFASSVAKRAPLEVFERTAETLSARMPVYWICGPEEELAGAVRMDNLYELACWLRGAKVFVGNDSGISHLAAAVGTPVMVFFRSTDARVWAPRGATVCVG